MVMNWSTVQGNWNEAKGKVRTKWGRLTDDDLTQVAGQKDRLVGVIQQKYGLARDKAEEQLEEFLSSGDSVIARAKEGAQEVIDKGREYVEKGREYVEKGVERGKEIVHQGKDYVQHTSSSQMASDLKELISRNPVHSALIGIGLGFLLGRLLTPSQRS
jgi:uncharacterized protein YjbJ (UPF0337 family)